MLYIRNNPKQRTSLELSRALFYRISFILSFAVNRRTRLKVTAHGNMPPPKTVVISIVGRKGDCVARPVNPLSGRDINKDEKYLPVLKCLDLKTKFPCTRIRVDRMGWLTRYGVGSSRIDKRVDADQSVRPWRHAVPIILQDKCVRERVKAQRPCSWPPPLGKFLKAGFGLSWCFPIENSNPLRSHNQLTNKIE